MSDTTRRHVLQILGASASAASIGCETSADDVADPAATPTLAPRAADRRPHRGPDLSDRRKSLGIYGDEGRARRRWRGFAVALRIEDVGEVVGLDGPHGELEAAVGAGVMLDDAIDSRSDAARINSWLREAEALGALRMLP